MRRILITGAAGFVGQHVTCALAGALPSLTTRIVGIGRGHPASLPDGVVFHPVDLLDRLELTRLVEQVQPTDVLHLAATSSVQQSTAAPTETWQSNVGGLLNIADAVCKFAPCSNFFFVSSGEVYGRSFASGQALTEKVEPAPIGSYAQSKFVGEQILDDIFAKTEVKLLILRPFNHIGPGQDDRFVVPSFAKQIALIEAGLKQPVVEVGNLDARRDFLPVDDVVKAYVKIIRKVDQIPSGKIFNISSGNARSISSILNQLRTHSRANFEVCVANDRLRPSEIPVAAGDATLLESTVGWKPAGDWNLALRNILDEVRKNLIQISVSTK